MSCVSFRQHGGGKPVLKGQETLTQEIQEKSCAGARSNRNVAAMTEDVFDSFYIISDLSQDDAKPTSCTVNDAPSDVSSDAAHYETSFKQETSDVNPTNVSVSVPFHDLSPVDNDDTRSAATVRSPLFSIPPDILRYLKKRPKANFNKNYGHIQLVILVKGHCKPIYKSFKCTKDGKKDPKVISEIEHFFRNDFVSWLESKSLQISTDELETKPKWECSDELSCLLQRSPTVKYHSESSSVEARFHSKSDKVYSKFFECGSAGIHDETTMAKVKHFLCSKEAVTWFLGKDRSSFYWVPAGEVRAGVETKLYFDKFEFDIRKEVEVSKDVKCVYQENHSTQAAFVVKNDKWGSTHLFDECYVPDPAVPSSHNKVAVTMYISCASKSSSCRTACGSLISSLQWGAVRTCPACSFDLSDKLRQCNHCLVNSSPNQWYSKDDKALCSACYQYEMKYQKPRPAVLRHSDRKIQPSYHPHVRCGWRMKFVIYFSDLSTWHIFNSSKNDAFHTQPAHQITKKPSSVSDKRKRQRVTNNATAKKILIYMNEKTSVSIDSQSEQQSFSEEGDTQDSIEPSETLMPSDQNPSENITFADNVAVSSDNVPTTGSKNKKKKSFRSDFASQLMLCTLCISERTKYPFSTNSWEVLCKHMLSCHAFGLIACPTCWNEYGIEEEFDSKLSLHEHYKLMHKGTGTKKVLRTLPVPSGNSEENTCLNPVSGDSQLVTLPEDDNHVPLKFQENCQYADDSTVIIEVNGADTEGNQLPLLKNKGNAAKRYLAASKYRAVKKKRRR